MKLSTDTKLIAALALGGAGLLWLISRNAAGFGKAAAGAAGDAAAGAVVGIGSWFGIPETNTDQCQRDMAAGNWSAASTSCPAGTWIKSGAGAAADTAATAVVKAGQVFGLPATSQSQCQRDLAAGNWWDASFSCPAGTFVGAAGTAVFGSTSVNEYEAETKRLLAHSYTGGASGGW